MKLRYTLALKSAQGILLLSTVVALALTALVVTNLRREYANEIQFSKDKTVTLTKLVEEHARQSLRRVDFSLQAIHRDLYGKASSDVIQTARMNQALRARLADDGLIDSFSILAPDGRPLATTLTDGDASKPGPILPDYIAAHQSLAKQPLFMGAAIKAPGTERWLIPVSIRIDGPDDSFQGVVLAMLRADYFQSFYDAMDAGTNGFVTLFTRDAWITARSPRIEKLFTQNWGASPLFKEHLPSDSFKTVRQVVVADGVERLYSYRALPDYPLVVSAGVSLTDALAPWRGRMWSASIALCIVLGALTLATVQLVRQVKRNARTETELKLTALSVSKASLPIFWIAQDARILRVNQAACDLHGYTEAQLLTMAITDLDPNFPVERWPLHWTELRQKKRMGFETIHRNCAGNLVPVEVDLNFVEFDGHEYNFAYVRDISSRKATEQQLVDAVDTAQAASLSKSQFLATMSHEIRAPLNVMKGMSYAMRRAGLETKQEECLVHIDTAANHLLTIVSAVLDLAKIDAGKFALEQLEINVGQIATDTADMLRGNAQAKNIHLRTEIPSDLAPLLGDATRLRQTLLNYLSNALKFTETGTITLRVSIENESDLDTTLRFEVQDTGIGISTETAAKLFTPFEQGDNSDTRQYGGTGLGLVITKRIAELMGGTVGFGSVPGVGSTFWFTARLQKPAPKPEVVSEALHEANFEPSRFIETLSFKERQESSPERVLQSHFSGKRILLVDDDSITRRLFQSLLKDLGLIADSAADGAIAVDKATAQAYDLVVMDMQMPKMGGLEATRHIRAIDGCKQVPIIMLTGNAFEHVKSECLAAGVSDFMTKPVAPEALFAMIVKWLTVVREPSQ